MRCRVLGSLIAASSISVLLAWTPAIAAGNAITAGKIAMFHVEAGNPYLRFDRVIGNPDGCTSADAVILPADLPYRETYVSVAMTALASGKSVDVWVDGCGPSPGGNSVPKVYAMQIHA